MKRFRQRVHTPKYEEFKQYIQERYDYISTLDIAKINRDLDYPVTIQECKMIYTELYR